MITIRGSIAGLTRSAIILASIFGISKLAHAGGGDYFQIYLNSKLVLNEVVGKPSTALSKGLQLTAADRNEELVIYYSHCGTVGTGRRIELKDENGKVYKEWDFNNSSADKGMRIPVREILEYQKQTAGLALFYHADQLQSKERMLVSLGNDNRNSNTIRERASYDMPFLMGGILVLGLIGKAILRA